jgi:hypothetical protein
VTGQTWNVTISDNGAVVAHAKKTVVAPPAFALMIAGRAPRPPAARSGRLLRVECAHDEPPRREAVLAPSVGRDDAVVGAPAHSVGDPLDEHVVVGRRPTTVEFEPRMRVADRVGGRDGLHEASIAGCTVGS